MALVLLVELTDILLPLFLHLSLCLRVERVQASLHGEGNFNTECLKVCVYEHFSSKRHSITSSIFNEKKSH